MGMPPAEFVAMAAELGVHRIGIAPSPITDNPHGYPAWDMRGDPALVSEVKQALADHGVAVSLGEGFLIMPGMDIASAEPAVDLMADLGAPVINAVLIEQDRARAQDQFGTLAGMAAARGQRLTLEFMPLMWPATLAEAAAFVRGCGAPNAALLVDAMHFYRSGAQTADLGAIDPALVGHIQVCDVPMPPRTDNYGEEARHERMIPGEGDLPLADFLSALPRDVSVGIELPMISKARAGISPTEALRPAISAMRKILAEVG
jgi:sugar phosphate isomerase/epimerase